MQKTSRSPMPWLASLMLLSVVGYSGNAHSQQTGTCTVNPGTTTCKIPQCPDNGSPLPGQCTKEIRVINNTTVTIWAAIQSHAIAGTDPWLAAALGGTGADYSTKLYYRAYINPPTGPQNQGGIPPGGIASINVPWWSKQSSTPSGNDTPYIDWWNGARLYIFDDLNALNFLYGADKTAAIVPAQGSPLVVCNSNFQGTNACNTAPSYTSQKDFDPSLSPAQLTEYTLASVEGDNPPKLSNLNQNYNISDVNEVYLPVAMETIGNPQQGWVGSILAAGTITNPAAGTFRDILNTFVGNVNGATNAPNWPIQTFGSSFPNAGILVPSTYQVFIHPEKYTDPNRTLPFSTDFISKMVKQWGNCIGSNPSPACVPSQSPYTGVNTAFRNNYTFYAGDPAATPTPVPAACPLVPPALQPPLSSTSNLFLAQVYGWVPFNQSFPTAGQCQPSQRRSQELPCSTPAGEASACTVPNSPVPGQYFMLQDNWQNNTNPATIFNFYAQLVHDKKYLGSNSTYAYSIDDLGSFFVDPGTGLVFAIGGSAGLPNQNPRPPTATNLNSIVVAPGSKPGDSNQWQSYGICSNTAPTPFTLNTSFFVNTKDPSVWTGPPAGTSCTVTLQDSLGNLTKIKILQTIPWNERETIETCTSPTVGLCNFVKPDMRGSGATLTFSIIVPTAAAD
jgi:hypothetical protein